MAKFKVGDKVRIIKKAEKSYSTGKYDYIGDIFTVTGINVVDTFPYSLSGTGYWWCDEELELVGHTQFTKADLKDGMVVEYRDGRKRVVLGKYLTCMSSHSELIGFTDDLKYVGRLGCIADPNLDIVKIYKSSAMNLGDWCNDDYLTVIWERPLEIEYVEMTIEEIEKIVGHKIKVVGSEDKT